MRQRLSVVVVGWFAVAVIAGLLAPTGEAATSASRPVNLAMPIDFGAPRPPAPPR